jgi:hypothetical protein
MSAKMSLEVGKVARKCVTERNINEATRFVASNKTIIVNGEWLCQAVPCSIVAQNDTETHVKPFNKSRVYSISCDVFVANFTPLNRDDVFVYAPNYPDGRIAISEFSVAPISLNKLYKHFEGSASFVQLLEKAYQDSYVGKGNTFCINMKAFNEYSVNDTTSKLERIGDPVFNRTVRHTVPISGTFTRKEFEECASFPAPMGIRAEDFALPSEQNDILKELLTQIFNCGNAPECPSEFRDKIGITITPNSHMCEWCGSVMDISELNQTYCSKEHSVNFCHRDPIIGTKRGNVYIGHCSCNREQGGYSEEQRVQQIIRLALTNPTYKEQILNALNK